MLTHLINAEKVLHIAYAFKFVRRNVVTRTTVSLGKNMFFAELFGRRNSSEVVHCGNILVFVSRHDARAAPHLHSERSFLDGMPREFTAVRAAPVV